MDVSTTFTAAGIAAPLGSVEFDVAAHRAEIEQRMLGRMREVFPGATAFLALQAVYDGVIPSTHPASLELAVISLLAAGLAWLGALEARHQTVGLPGTSLGIAMTGLLVAVQLLHIWLLSHPAFVLPLIAVQFGAGFLLLSPQILGFLLSLSAVAWCALAAPGSAMEVWLPLGAAMLMICGWSFHNGVRSMEGVQRDRRERDDEAEAIEKARFEQEAREARLAREQLAIEAATDGHWHWNLDDDACYYSAGWAALVGFDEADLEATPQEWLNRIHPHYLPQVKEDLSAHLYGRTPRFQSQFRIQTREGSYIWALARGAAQRDEEGNPLSISGSMIDVTHLVQAEKAMIDDAFQDRLTGLANRKALMIRLERSVEEIRQEHSLLAVIFMDLDRFKVVNDTHGHLVGDQLLAAAASRLRGCLRQRTGDILARFGGDEFVALLEDLRKPDEAIAVAKRFQEVLRKPFRIGEHDISSGGSVGIAFSDTRVEAPADLLRNADTAMYRAKASQSSDPQVFNTEMYEETLRLYALENDLGRALERDEFVLEYQPVIAMNGGSIVGAEALLRWKRSGGELIPPAEFVPIAEESGNIEAIGEWVLQKAVEQNAEWQRMGLPPIKIAVNLSAKQVQRKGLPATIQRVLQATGLHPSWLELELTETALMENLDEASATIATLQKAGVRVSIDDFGTGYSSLGYLRRFSFDSLKMDRSFVADLTTDPKSLAVAQGLIKLAHNLKLKVTAEGVETRQQLALLKGYGCDQFQGFLASRPVTAEKFGELLRSGARLAEERVELENSGETASGQPNGLDLELVAAPAGAVAPPSARPPLRRIRP